MRKTTILLSIMVLAAMVLAACGGGATSTNVSPTQLPVTSVATEPSTATEMPTATEAPIATETPGIPVTGAAGAAGQMSERLKFQVLDQTGAKLGTVSDLVLNLSKAQVVYVLVNAGGKKVAVPRDMFTVQSSASMGTGVSTSTPSTGTGGAGTGSSTSTPAGIATGQTGTGTDLSTSTPSAGSSSGTGTGAGSSMSEQANAFIFMADATMLQNAPKFDDKNMPGLGVSPDSWDIAIRNYWNGNGAGTGSNTPSAVGTAVTDMTPTTTGGTGTGSGTGLATSTPESSTGSSLSTSTPSVPVTGSNSGTVMGATSIQGVVLASQVIGAKVTVGMPGAGTGTGSTGTSSSTSTPAGMSSSTATPGAGGTGSSTSTPSAGGSGTGSSTSTPSAGSSSGTGTGSGTGTAANVSGTISDLLVDNSGTILYVVVRTTANAGSLIPVPLHFLQLDSDSNFVLNVDPAMLQTAPSFESGQFPDMSTSGWDSQFSSFWQSNGTGSGGMLPTATP